MGRKTGSSNVLFFFQSIADLMCGQCVFFSSLGFLGSNFSPFANSVRKDLVKWRVWFKCFYTLIGPPRKSIKYILQKGKKRCEKRAVFESQTQLEGEFHFSLEASQSYILNISYRICGHDDDRGGRSVLPHRTDKYMFMKSWCIF